MPPPLHIFGAAAAGAAVGAAVAAAATFHCLHAQQEPTATTSAAAPGPAPAAVAAPQVKHWGVEGKLVVVSGGAQGIGRSVALEFARQGAFVVAVDIAEAFGASLVEEAKILSGDIKFIKADMSDNAVPERVIKAAISWQAGKPVAVLVNNVGIQIDNNKPVHLLPEELWDKVLDVNLKSYFLMSKHALPGMLNAKAGVIIHIGSVQGMQSQVGIPAYATSKGGILSLTRQMAMDYSSVGVRTVSISPGTIRTPLVHRLVEEDGNTCEALGATYPLGKMGEPEDIANLALFLASDYAANITGTNVCCDGGIMGMGSWDRRVGFTSYTK